MHVWKMLGLRWCAICIFLFQKSINFIKGIAPIYIIFLKVKIIVFILINLFKYLKLLTALMYLSLNKLTSKYGKRVFLILQIHCIKFFPFILNCFSFVSKSANFVIHWRRFLSKKNLQIYPLTLFRMEGKKAPY